MSVRLSYRRCRAEGHCRMRREDWRNAMKTRELRRTRGLAAAIVLAGVAALVAGCVERRVVYVPTYQVPPGYPPPPAYTYQPQGTYTAPPAARTGQAVSPSTPDSAAGMAAPAPAAAAPASAPIVAQAPPAPQVEVIPAAPGPDYVWGPGYWTWNGGWVWVSGGWIIRPHPGAAWVGGHWGRRGRGYVWIGGYWR